MPIRSPRRKSPAKNRRSPRHKSPAKNTRSPRRKLPTKKSKKSRSPRRKLPTKKSKKSRSPRRKSPLKKSRSPINGKLMRLKGGGKNKYRCRTCQGSISPGCSYNVGNKYFHMTGIDKCRKECDNNKKSTPESSVPKVEVEVDRVINTKRVKDILTTDVSSGSGSGSTKPKPVLLGDHLSALFSTELHAPERRSSARLLAKASDESAPERRSSARLLAKASDESAPERSLSARLLGEASDESVPERRSSARLLGEASDESAPERRSSARLLAKASDESAPERRSSARLLGEASDESDILNPDPSRVNPYKLYLLKDHQQRYKETEKMYQKDRLNMYKRSSTYDHDDMGDMTIVYSSDSVNKTDPLSTVRNPDTIEVHCTIIRRPKDSRKPGGNQFYGHITLVINRDLSDIKETYHYGMRRPNSEVQSFWCDEITGKSGYLRELKDGTLLLTYKTELESMFPAHNNARRLMFDYYNWCIESCPDVKPVFYPDTRKDVLTFKQTTSW